VRGGVVKSSLEEEGSERGTKATRVDMAQGATMSEVRRRCVAWRRCASVVGT
jgi:hypothetical protein